MFTFKKIYKTQITFMFLPPWGKCVLDGWVGLLLTILQLLCVGVGRGGLVGWG